MGFQPRNNPTPHHARWPVTVPQRLRSWAIRLGVAAIGAPFAASLVGLGAAVLMPAAAQAQAAAEAPQIRKEWAPNLKAAQDALAAQNYAGALEALKKADAQGERNAAEHDAYYRMLGQAAVRTQNDALAIEAYQGLLSKGLLAPAAQFQVLEVLTSLQFNTKQYPAAIASAEAALKNPKFQSSSDPQAATQADRLQLLIAQAAYLSGDNARAAQQSKALIEADIKAGRKPAADRLQLLASAHLRAKNQEGYKQTLVYYVTYYPKPEYWSDLIYRTGGGNLPDRLQTEAGRLSHTVNAMADANEFILQAELLEKAGHPIEAAAVLQKGYAAGKLGTGAQATQHNQLRDRLAKQVKEDQPLQAKQAQQLEAGQDVPTTNGNVQARTGYNLVLAGYPDQGFPMLEKALNRDGLRNPDDVRLTVGAAYAVAGKLDDARRHLKAVKGADGAAELAQLWLIHIGP